MGTDKRARQKAGRAARVEAAREAQRKAESRSKLFRVLGVVLLAVALIGAFWFLTNRDDDDEAALDTASSTTTLLPSTTAAASAAGKPCVALVDPLPAGAPNVPVPEGPPPTELVTEDLVVGPGEEVPAGATVTVNYIGVSCSTGTIFDDSYSRGEPVSFPLDGVIQGWTDGIPGMKVGGQRLLVIPPDQAYGSSGRPGIAPDETLVFVVDLVAIGDTTSTTAAGSASTTATTAAPATTVAP